MTRSPNTESAQALAKALDTEDYGSARALLDDACIYEIRGELIEGAEAIIESYRSNGEQGRRRFDSVCFESAVAVLTAQRARIDYTDIVTRSGDTHVYRCAQEIEFGASGSITRIAHIDLPGEMEALEEFKATHL